MALIPIRSLLLIALLFNGFNLLAQTVLRVNSKTYDNPLSGTYDVQARDYIRFKPGARISPQGTPSASGRFSINEFITIPVNYPSPIDIDTRNINTSLPVGTIPGVADVTLTGGASYTVPINIPPGTSGIQPSLSVVYNSQGGNGLLGKGWNLSGISAISRAGPTMYHEGYAGPIKFDVNDRFTLDGMGLFDYPGNWGEFRTEIESYTKIIAHDMATGPSAFTATTKDGRILEFGHTADSKIKLPNTSKVLHWAVNRIIDAKGNYMDFVYEEVDAHGTIIIKEIKYTGNKYNGQQPFTQIKFRYDYRDDKESGFIANQEVQQTVLLNQISIYQENLLIKKYQFNYTKPFNSVLSEIIEYASGTKLNSTVFNYHDAPNSFQVDNFGLSGENALIYSGDFDGDGLDDVVKVPYLTLLGTQYHGPFKIFKRTTSDPTYTNTYTATYNVGLVENSTGSAYSQNYIAADYDGDGKDDIIVTELDASNRSIVKNFKMFSSQDGSSFTETNFSPPDLIQYAGHHDYYNIISPGMPYYLPGDFNGDGLTDFITILSNGTTTKAFITQPHFNNKNQEITNLLSYVEEADIRVIDFDGDGKHELMAIKDNTTILSLKKVGTDYNVVQLTPSPLGFPTKWQKKLLTGDFNGDLKTDFLTQNADDNWQVAYSTGEWFYGTSFSFNNTIGSSDKLLIADFNGDGKSDIYHSNNVFNGDVFKPAFTNNVNIYYKSGSTFLNEKASFSSPFNIIHSADFNGDGRSDIIRAAFIPINGTSIQTPFQILSFKPYGQEHLLKKVSNGLGLITEFGYNRLTEGGAFYTKGTGETFPMMDFQVPLYAVSYLKSQNGVGGYNQINYSYKGAKLHRQGKGFLGFSSITARNATLNTETERIFNFNRTYFFSEPSKEEIKLASGELISKTDYTNDLHAFGSKRIFTFKKKEVKTSYLPKSAGGYETIVNTIEYDYYTDDANNNRNIKEIKTSQNGIISSVTLFENYSSDGSWCPHVPKKTTETVIRGGTSNEKVTTYEYDGDGSPQTIITYPGKAESIKTEYMKHYSGIPKRIIVSTPNNAQLSPRYTYNEFDTYGRFLVKGTNPLGHSFTKTYDPATGNLLTHTDANGLISIYSYDGFGRLFKTIDPAGIETHHALKWAAGAGPSGASTYKETSGQGMPTVKTWLDLLGRELQSESEGFDGTKVYSQTGYNAKGQVATKIRLKSASEADYAATYTYDPRGRVLTAATPASTTIYEYDGFKTTETSSSGQWSKRTLNGLGEATIIEDVSGKIYCNYSPLGKPTVISFHPVSGATSTTVSTFDEFGRQTKLLDPNAGLTVYEYNAYGELIKQVDGKGNETTPSYDLLGRMTEKKYKDVNAAITTFTYEYDNGTNAKGKIVKETSPGAEIRYAYNSLGRLASATKTAGSETFTKSYTYDNLGRIIKETYPSGFSTVNEYNAKSYLEKIKRGDNGGNIWEAQFVNSRGRVTEWTLGTSGLNANGYLDEHGNLESQNYASNITDIWSASYAFEASTGNLERRHKTTTEDFTYDNLNRLTVQAPSLSGAPAHVTDYDDMGNIIKKTDAGEFKYGENGAGPHAMTTAEPFKNIPTLTQDITYTPFNSVKTIEEDNKKAVFTYGPDEQRATMSYYEDGDLKYTMYYFGNYEKKVDMDGNTREWSYINTPSGLSAVFIKDKARGATTEKLFYIVQDHLGSIMALIHESGTIAEEFSYDAWGRRRNPQYIMDYGVTPSEYITRGFTGHEHLDEFGIINMNGRLYDPVTGRMLSTDNFVQEPGNSQSYNRYSYAFNNPLKFTDPDGENPVVIGIAVMAAYVYLQGAQANDWEFRPWKWGSTNNAGQPIYYQAGIGGNSSGVNSVSAGISAGSPGQMVTANFANQQAATASGNINWSNVNASRSYGPTYNMGAKPNIHSLSYQFDAADDVRAGFTPISSINLNEVVVYGMPNSNTGGSFGIDPAIHHMNTQALNRSSGYCARYVRQGLEAGGINTAGHPGTAREYGPYLQRWGFTPMDEYNYTPMRGDIGVIQPYPGGNPAGHIQMYNGQQWISDFRQRDFWPGGGYRTHQPNFQIYRWPFTP